DRPHVLATGGALRGHPHGEPGGAAPLARLRTRSGALRTRRRDERSRERRAALPPGRGVHEGLRLVGEEAVGRDPRGSRPSRLTARSRPDRTRSTSAAARAPEQPAAEVSARRAASARGAWACAPAAWSSRAAAEAEASRPPSTRAAAESDPPE